MSRNDTPGNLTADQFSTLRPGSTVVFSNRKAA
jgi:hypothetical protein